MHGFEVQNEYTLKNKLCGRYQEWRGGEWQRQSHPLRGGATLALHAASPREATRG